jgi:hypothetical protein
MPMDPDQYSASWLLLLTQLPSSASSPRVALWRRLRAAGATMMVSSVWVLPETGPHAELFEQLRDRLVRQGGIGFVLSIPAAAGDVNAAIVSRFQTDRGREYDEFAERCAALLDEIGKESKAGKYIFAELEENEQELEKLVRWLAKIQARDFFPDERGKEAAAMLARCQSAVEGFSQLVYAAEEVTGDVGESLTALRWPAGLDPARVHGERQRGICRRERLLGDKGAVQRQAGRQPGYLEFAQRPARPLERLGPGGPRHDQLGQQRAERRVDDRALLRAGIQPHAGAGRGTPRLDGPPRPGETASRVLSVDPELERVPARPRVAVAEHTALRDPE